MVKHPRRPSVLLDHMIEVLRLHMANDGFTQVELARRARITPNAVYQVLRDGDAISIARLELWAALLGYRFTVRLIKEEQPSDAARQ